MSPKPKSKLTQYVPGQNQGFPFFIIGVVVIAVLAIAGVFRSGVINPISKGGRDDVVAQAGNFSKSVPAICQKAGINLAGPFGHADTTNLIRAKSLGMGWILAIATEPSEATFVAERIKAANALGLNTILRICYHDNCGFKEVSTYIQFLKDVSDQTGGETFYAIAGPNEPLNENWLPGTENIPIPIPSNPQQYATIADKLVDYMNAVIDGVGSIDNIKLLSPIFNFGRFDFYEPFLREIKANGPKFSELDGIAGNVYMTDDGQLIADKGDNQGEMDDFKAAFPGMDLYVTETGSFTGDIEGLVQQVRDGFVNDDQVKAYLFFNAFGTNADPQFQNFVMSNEQLAYVIEGATGEDCTEFIPDPNVEPDEGATFTDSVCPFDGNFPKDLESCQTLSTNKDQDYPAKAGCGVGATVCTDLPIYKCDGTGAAAAICAAAGRPADGRWYTGFETTSQVEKIPMLRYLQAVTGSYTDDDLPDDGVDKRDIQSIPPCFLRNVSNFFPNVDWSNKFDGRVSLSGASSPKNKTFGVFPLLGTAAGCMVYNQNDFHGSFNKIASGFIEKENVKGLTTEKQKVGGLFDGLLDIIAAIRGFDLKDLFGTATDNQEQVLDTPLCTLSMSPAVSRLNGKDTIDLTANEGQGREYESVIDSEELMMTDTELCDRQILGQKSSNKNGGIANVKGAECNVNGYIFTTSSTIEIKDADGNVIQTIDYATEKRKNNEQVSSVGGHPVLDYEYKHVDEIALDGMKRAIAGAYLDEALFFHSLGTRPGEYASKTGGYRVIHNINTGIQVPMRLRVYDIMNHQTPQGGGGKNGQEDADLCTTDIDFYGGEFGLANNGKYRGHDIYIIPWMGQIPRMYGRISAIGTDYKLDDTGNIVALSGTVTENGEQRLLHCQSPEYKGGEDCVVEWGSTKRDPLMDWLIAEGVLSEAEIKGTFGYSFPKPDNRPNMCKKPVASSSYEDLMKKVASFLNSQPGGSRITWNAMWGILSQESLRRCTPDYGDWTSTLQTAKGDPLTLPNGDQVANYTDTCTGDPNQIGLATSPHDTVMGVSQMKAGTFNSIADNFWRNATVRAQYGITTGELLKRCVQYLGVDQTKGQETSRDEPDPIEERFRETVSRKRVGDSLCAMAIMLSENAARQNDSKGNAYVAESEWTDSVLWSAADIYYGSDTDPNVCPDSYCDNVVYYSNFAKEKFGTTPVEEPTSEVSCQYESSEGNVNVYSGSCQEIFNAIKDESPYADTQVGRNAVLNEIGGDTPGEVCHVDGQIFCDYTLTNWCQTCPVKANLLLRHELNHVIAGSDFFGDGNVSEFAADATSLNGGWYKFKYKGGGTTWELATVIKDWIMTNYMTKNGVSEKTFIDYLNGNFSAKATLDRVFAENGGINVLMQNLIFGRTISSTAPPAASNCAAQIPTTPIDQGLEKNSCGVFDIAEINASRLTDSEKELYKKIKASLVKALQECESDYAPTGTGSRHIKFCPKLTVDSCSADVFTSGWSLSDRNRQFEVVIVSDKFIDPSSPYYSLVENLPAYAAMTTEEAIYYTGGKQITYPNTLIINFDRISANSNIQDPVWLERLWLHEFAHIEQAWGVRISSNQQTILSRVHVDANGKHTVDGRFFEACADEDMDVSPNTYKGPARMKELRNLGISSQLIEDACRGDLGKLATLKAQVVSKGKKYHILC